MHNSPALFRCRRFFFWVGKWAGDGVNSTFWICTSSVDMEALLGSFEYAMGRKLKWRLCATQWNRKEKNVCKYFCIQDTLLSLLHEGIGTQGPNGYWGCCGGVGELNGGVEYLRLRQRRRVCRKSIEGNFIGIPIRRDGIVRMRSTLGWCAGR